MQLNMFFSNLITEWCYKDVEKIWCWNLWTQRVLWDNRWDFIKFWWNFTWVTSRLSCVSYIHILNTCYIVNTTSLNSIFQVFQVVSYKFSWKVNTTSTLKQLCMRPREQHYDALSLIRIFLRRIVIKPYPFSNVPFICVRKKKNTF